MIDSHRTDSHRRGASRRTPWGLLRRRPSRLPGRIAVALLVAALGVTALAGAQGGEQATGRFTVSGGSITAICKLTLGGSFEAVSDRVEGRLAPSPDQAGRFDGTLQVPIDTIDTGIGLRNTHMRENYLETGKGPAFSHARLARITLARPDVIASGGRSDFHALLTLHGVDHTVRGDARLTPSGGEVRVEASFPVYLPDYQIPEPRYLGVGVRDNVDVRVDVTFTRAGGSP